MAYDVKKIWGDIHWLERMAEEKRHADPEGAMFYRTRAHAKREVLEDMGLGGTEPAYETTTLAGREFRSQDADERNWYLADDGFGAWVCETEDFVAAVEHSDGCWRCEVTWGEQYVKGGAREFSTPEEAAETVLRAYEGVLAGTVDAGEWC